MDAKEDTQMKSFASQVIDALGGTSRVASLCETTASAVAQWRDNGIPHPRLMFLKLARPDVFAAQDAAQPESGGGSPASCDQVSQ